MERGYLDDQNQHHCGAYLKEVNTRGMWMVRRQNQRQGGAYLKEVNTRGTWMVRRLKPTSMFRCPTHDAYINGSLPH